MLIPPFREVQPRIAEFFRENGCLGVVLVDLTPLARIERSFGSLGDLMRRTTDVGSKNKS